MSSEQDRNEESSVIQIGDVNANKKGSTAVGAFFANTVNIINNIPYYYFIPGFLPLLPGVYIFLKHNKDTEEIKNSLQQLKDRLPPNNPSSEGPEEKLYNIDLEVSLRLKEMAHHYGRLPGGEDRKRCLLDAEYIMRRRPEPSEMLCDQEIKNSDNNDGGQPAVTGSCQQPGLFSGQYSLGSSSSDNSTTYSRLP